MSYRNGFYAAGISAIALAIFLVRLWQPEAQVRKHSEHLLEAVMDHDWDRFDRMVADEYRDQWGHDRATVLERTKMVAHYARGLQIHAIGSNVQVENRSAKWRAYISIDGAKDDEGIAMMKERLSTVKTPFELEWRRNSGKPWDWKLVGVRNPQLELPASYY
jgi:hypothetical protein